MAEPAATAVIVTKDRREETVAAVASALEQRPPVEVLVIDDGSSDGTADAVTSAFPAAAGGQTPTLGRPRRARNEAARLAAAPIIVSIDDDAVFTDAGIVAAAVAAFDDPRVGVVAIPYVDVPQGEHVLQAASGDGLYATHRFRGTAHAVRKDVFLEVGGYRAMLFQQAEEPDLAIRLLDAGYIVRLGRGEPNRHFGSPKRDMDVIWFYECRNEVLFAWHNIPMPDILLRLAKVAVNNLRLGVSVRRPSLFVRGLGGGVAAILRERATRSPVSRRTWRLYDRLARRPLPVEEIASALPKAAR